MSLRTQITRLWQTRRLLKTLDRIAAAQEQQVRLLGRLTDQLAPTFEPASEEDLRKHSGLSFSRDAEVAKVLDHCEKVFRDTGHQPTEEEIADYLDEEERTH